MNRRGHLAFALAVTAASTPWLIEHVGPVAGAGYAATQGAGALAPDRLEGSVLGGRRLIPHRTLTHYLPLWAVPSALALVALLQGGSLLIALLLGFLVGGLGHVVLDASTPMGVPILHPGKRHQVPISGGALMLLAYLAAAAVLWFWFQ